MGDWIEQRSRRAAPVTSRGLCEVRDLVLRPERDVEVLKRCPLVRFRLRPPVSLEQRLIVGHPEAARHIFEENAGNYKREERVGCVLAQLMGAGLVTGDDDLWEQHHGLVAPAIRSPDEAKLVRATVGATKQMLQRISGQAASGIELFGELRRIALQTAGAVLLDYEFGAEVEEFGSAFTRVIGELGERLMPFSLRLLPLGLLRETRLIRRRVEGLIAERRRTREHGTDLLAQLLTARRPETRARLDDVAVRDLIVAVLFTAHEALACALNWCFLLLALHRKLQDRIQEQLDEVLGDSPVNTRNLERLELAHCAFDEALRLYPPVPRLTRVATGDDTIMGYDVTAGTVVQISIYALHHHPDYWSNPESFDPARFSEQRAEGRHPFSYMPFGAGPHACLGKGLARNEATIVLAEVLRRYSIQLAPGCRIEPEGKLSLRARYPLRFVLEPRRDVRAVKWLQK